MPTSCAPRDKACAVCRVAGGGSKADEPSSPSFYMILVRRPSTARHKHLPAATPDNLAPVLRQAAGILLSSSTCCRASTFTHGQGLQGQATPILNTLLGGVPEELLGHAARAAHGCCSGSRAAGRALGIEWTGQVSGEAGRARLVSRSSPVGFWPSAHLRGSRSHVRASGSRV